MAILELIKPYTDEVKAVREDLTEFHTVWVETSKMFAIGMQAMHQRQRVVNFLLFIWPLIVGGVLFWILN